VADGSLKRDGVVIPLTPKQFDLLVTLVKNAGRLVETDTLLKSGRPDVAVEEGNPDQRHYGRLSELRI
jgi:DNA-binding winged helix-turn-helix (wHTH) protein